MYDIRRPANDPVLPGYFVKYLNLPATQTALGVDPTYRYEPSSADVYSAFQQSGDYVFPIFLEDLEYLLEKGIRVVYVCSA